MVTVESQLQPVTATQPLALAADRVVLTGFMGAGKSTVGRALAAELGWEFIDLDDVILERERAREGANITIADLFARHGEATFRQMETRALATTLGRKNVVIALGGGAIESQANRLLMEQKPKSVVVFLDAPFGVLFDRCVLQPGAAIRPVLQNPDAAAERYKTRHPHYRRVAKIVIQTELKTPAKTVEAIVREIAPRKQALA